jgi:hypothetical protein
MKTTTKTASKPAAAPKPAKPAPKPARDSHEKGNGQAADKLAAVAADTTAKGGVDIGFLLSWNAQGVDVARADAKALFGAADLAKLIPDALAPETALTRAAAEGVKPKGYAVRAAESVDATVFVYRVTRGDDTKGDTFDSVARVSVDPNGNVAAADVAGGTPDPVGIEWARSIAYRANHAVTHVAAKDISAALVKAAHELHAVPLRAAGGVYFAHPGELGRWRALAGGLAKLGFAPITIPMVASPDANAAAQGAVSGALDGELADLAKDLESARLGMRGDAIERRVELAEGIISRANLYQGVLEDLAAGIRERAEEIRVEFLASLEKERASSAAKQSAAAPVPGTFAAKMAEAGRKAWATRLANRQAAAEPPSPAPDAAVAAE